MKQIITTLKELFDAARKTPEDSFDHLQRALAIFILGTVFIILPLQFLTVILTTINVFSSH